MPEEIIEYYQFPEFLLDQNVSDCAKLVYMLLYNRTRLSMSNLGWHKDGKVYCFFTAPEIGKYIGKSESAVRRAFVELKKVGLLETERRGIGSMCFVKVPDRHGENDMSFMSKMTGSSCQKRHTSNYKKVTSAAEKPAPSGAASRVTGRDDLELVYNKETGRNEWRRKTKP